MKKADGGRFGNILAAALVVLPIVFAFVTYRIHTLITTQQSMITIQEKRIKLQKEVITDLKKYIELLEKKK